MVKELKEMFPEVVKRPEDFEYNGITFMKNSWYEVVNPPDPAILLLLPGISQGALSLV